MHPKATLRTGFDRTRASPFSYRCNACSRCCQGKLIPLNPYEVARLAALLQVTTTEFLAKHTETGGAILARRDDDTCVFLGPNGCTVHAARPLACRLYPLGRHVAPSGDETFAELVPHPKTEGVYGENGTVDDYLRAQDTARHIAATDRYYALLRRMLAVHLAREDRAAVSAEATEAMQRAPTPDDESLLDMDATVRRHCAAHGIEVPADVEEKTKLHIAALEDIVRAMSS